MVDYIIILFVFGFEACPQINSIYNVRAELALAIFRLVADGVFFTEFFGFNDDVGHS